MRKLTGLMMAVTFAGQLLGQLPAARSGSQRVTWRVRTLVGDQRLLQWRTAPAADAFPNLTFTESVDQANGLGLNMIEGSSTQMASPDIRKNLEHTLSPSEIQSLQAALKLANVRMVSYRAGVLPPDEATLRNVLQFAKGLGADTVIASEGQSSLPTLGKAAAEVGVRVALSGRSNPASALTGLDNVANRNIGLAADTGDWLTAAVKPMDAIVRLKDRIFAINLRDRSAVGPAGADVELGSGAGNISAMLTEMNRLALRPVVLTLNPVKKGHGLASTVTAFEKLVQPALGEFVVAVSKSMPIRSGQSLPDDIKAKIDAAIPRAAYAKPKKPRKLLVVDACVANMSHNTIPHFNLAIELMAKYTDAFEPVFSNDLDNLKWPTIKQFDAIYLNDTVGELFPDLQIRQNLLRYVREGGGIGGWHGSGWASRSWRELGEMMGGMDAPHRIEPAYIKLDDPKSPINKAFDGTGLQHTEEYYRFNYEGPTAFYSRDNLHVLLSLDVDKSPEIMRPGRNGEPFFARPDKDYAIAWIRSYGKGRVFYNSMGHMPETMMSKPIMGHILAAIQFLVGDLEADTTPSAKLAKK